MEEEDPVQDKNGGKEKKKTRKNKELGNLPQVRRTASVFPPTFAPKVNTGINIKCFKTNL